MMSVEIYQGRLAEVCVANRSRRLMWVTPNSEFNDCFNMYSKGLIGKGVIAEDW